MIGYRQAMTLEKQPKKLIIVGSGAIGIEFAYFYNTMGTDVTVVEYMRIVPVEDEDVSKQLERSFKKWNQHHDVYRGDRSRYLRKRRESHS